MKVRRLMIPILMVGLGACSGIYYGAMEKLGVHRRDIMVARVRAARMVRNDRED